MPVRRRRASSRETEILLGGLGRVLQRGAEEKEGRGGKEIADLLLKEKKAYQKRVNSGEGMERGKRKRREG